MEDVIIKKKESDGQDAEKRLTLGVIVKDRHA
jgi:hypothetical protein